MDTEPTAGVDVGERDGVARVADTARARTVDGLRWLATHRARRSGQCRHDHRRLGKRQYDNRLWRAGTRVDNDSNFFIKNSCRSHADRNAY